MAVDVVVVPAAPVATVDFCRVDVTGADQNDLTAYDADLYPSSPEMRYYLTFEKGGKEYGRSYVFGVSDEGDHSFYNYLFPSSGSWTVRLKNAATDADVHTASVTAS